MKRFLVFAWEDNYHPTGGWDALQVSYDTLEEAKAHLEAYLDGKGCFGQGHIVDSKDWLIVERRD